MDSDPGTCSSEARTAWHEKLLAPRLIQHATERPVSASEDNTLDIDSNALAATVIWSFSKDLGQTE